MIFFSAALYGVLGLILSLSGVGIISQPVNFIAIMVLVGLINFVSNISSLKENLK